MTVWHSSHLTSTQSARLQLVNDCLAQFTSHQHTICKIAISEWTFGTVHISPAHNLQDCNWWMNVWYSSHPTNVQSARLQIVNECLLCCISCQDTFRNAANTHSTWLSSLLDPYTSGGVQVNTNDVMVDLLRRMFAGASVPAVLAMMLALGSHGDSSWATRTSRGMACSFLCLCLSGRRSKYSSVTATTRTR